jgi:DNA repair protein SbcC/Rad50
LRPISLDIEGLHSFKDPVHIDFKEVCEGGLFGIFGPTGSGKSTILDALTLALYGEVTRARGTLGILHVGCNKVRVSFCFDIQVMDGRREYTVERIYVKNKDHPHACLAKGARLLLKQEDAYVPLCDKPREVTGKVVEILGLTHADFIRAVVLPQNQFQEFLLMKESEKRSMLERIFYLEEYGKVLSDKISRKKGELEGILAEAEGKLSVLEEASDKALKEAEGNQLKAKSQKEMTQKAFAEEELRFKEAKEIWELLGEKNEMEEKIRIHAEGQSRVLEDKKKLLKASYAILIKDILLKVKEEEDRLVILDQEEEQSRLLLEDAKKKKEALTTILAQWESEVERQMPLLVVKKTQLETARVIQKERMELEEKRKAKIQTFMELKSKKDTLDAKIENQKATILPLEEKKEAFFKKMEELKIDLDYKDKVVGELRVEEELKECKRTIVENQNILEGYQIQQRDLKEQEIRKKLENEAQKAKENARIQEIHDLELVLEQKKAHVLAQKLTKGEPCPVCGSKEHPKPYEMHLEVEAQAGLLKAQIERTPNTLNEMKEALACQQRKILEDDAKIHRLRAEIDFLEKNIQVLMQKHQDLEARFMKADTRHQEFLSFYGIPSAKEAYAQILSKEKALEQSSAQLQEIQNKVKRIEEELKREQPLQNSLLAGLSSVETEGKALKEAILEREEKISQIAGGKDIEKEIEELDKQRVELLEKPKEGKESLQKWVITVERESQKMTSCLAQKEVIEKQLAREKENVGKKIREDGFLSIEDMLEALLSQEDMKKLEEGIQAFETLFNNQKAQLEMVLTKLKGRSLSKDEWVIAKETMETRLKERDRSWSDYEVQKNFFSMQQGKNKEWKKVQTRFLEVQKKRDRVEELQKLFRGNQFIDYVAEERLRYIAAEASETLGVLTRYRYALEIDADTQFIIRDDYNGGVHRPVSSLSGGETFLTALSLALALSAHIQLKGKSPLEFFFLDEGFGTLDASLLDSIMDSLERLGSKERMIGLISHVPELQHRISKKILVYPPNRLKGEGSTVHVIS